MPAIKVVKVVIANAVISYPHLFVPTVPKGATVARYSASLILPKNFDWTEVKAAIEEIKHAKWPNGAPAKLESQISAVDEAPYTGHFKINANASLDHKPQAVDQNLAPIMDTSMLFAGCIVNAQVAFFDYDSPKNGIGVGLNMIQLVKSDGVTRLDSTQAPEEVFQKIAGAPPVQESVALEQQYDAPVDSAPPPIDQPEPDPWA